MTTRFIFFQTFSAMAACLFLGFAALPQIESLSWSAGFGIFECFSGFLCCILVPLGFQTVAWLIRADSMYLPSRGEQTTTSTVVTPPHPAFFLAVFSLVLLLGLWQIGRSVARRIPSLCEVYIETSVHIETKSGSSAKFNLLASGSGNADNYQINFLELKYLDASSEHWPGYLRIDMDDQRALFGYDEQDSFAFTQERLRGLLQDSNDLPPRENRSIAADLWKLIQDYSNGRNLPELQFYMKDYERRPAFGYYVPLQTVYAVTSVMVMFLLIGPVWFLSWWYARYQQLAEEKSDKTSNSSSRETITDNSAST